MTGKGKNPYDSVLKVVIFSVNGVNNQNSDKSINENGWKFHVIFSAPKNCDRSDNNEWKEEEKLVEEVDEGGG